MASQFVTSHSAMVQLQENLVHEQNLFLSLLGSVWRRVSPELLHLHLDVLHVPHDHSLCFHSAGSLRHAACYLQPEGCKWECNWECN